MPHARGFDLDCARGSLLGGDDGISGRGFASRLEIPLRLLLSQTRLFGFLARTRELCLDTRGGLLADACTLGFSARALELVAEPRIALGPDSADLSFEREAGGFLSGQSSPLDLGQANALGLFELRGQTLLGFRTDAFELRLELLLGFMARFVEFFGQRTSCGRLRMRARLVDLFLT